jgi:hypothetical protein
MLASGSLAVEALASDLGHAGFGIARQRLDGGVQDPRDTAVGVGASGPRARGRGRAGCVSWRHC